MKKIILILVAVVVAAFAFKKLKIVAINNKIRSFFGKANTPAATAQTTSTQTQQAPWFPSWGGFTQASLTNTTSNVRSAVSQLRQFANNFGSNDGGTQPGVAIAGSNNGGTQSSGSGAGVPVDDSVNDSWP